MTTELATKDDASMTAFNPEKVELLKRTICKGATNDELELFIHACKRMGLDPFMKQIHAVKRKQKNDRGDWIEVMSIQTGIDGYRLIADRTERYMPGREPTFQYNNEGGLIAATAYVKKLGKDGVWHEIAATAHWSEYVGLTRDGNPTRMWADKPHIMLGKCAEALALRRAFPAELSGVYTREEMEQADTPAIEPPAPTKQLPQQPQTNEPDEAEKFLIQLKELFDAGDFTQDDREVVIGKVCRSKKVKDIRHLSVADRAAMLNALADGKFDKEKAEAVTA